MAIRSLIINPGSTSTKIGVFDDEKQILDKTLRHSTEEIEQYPNIYSQKDFRKQMVIDALKEENIEISSLNVCVGRGGLLKSIPGGTYAVTDALLNDLIHPVQGEHASNLGGILAREIGDSIGVPSYIVDPVVVDELEPVARISGVPEIERVSIDHPLNQKAMARKYAKSVGKKYEDVDVIVVHMGGGTSCGVHHNGRMIDVFAALNGDGAFSPERANGLPALALVNLCFSGKFSYEEMKKKIVGGGGFNAYLGTNDMREVNKMCDEGNEKAKLIREAFIYQICKNIGACATVLKGKVDQIILTGGIAYGKNVTDAITERVEWIAPVTVYAGEDELLALAQGALRVMNGEEAVKEY
ncbi:butyrate kinase [Butyrivibrio sp. NC3005]|uniref:butyrate kinase n=1 Tax=Butyrivibrio sp. NC3005 TaxID=1280685 RepID=UPI00042919C8|nr:butyrate kinase [Butyrivibrio sp. NC3005]